MVLSDRRNLPLSIYCVLATFLEGWGRRVQYSVFECFLDLSRMQNLYEAVKKYVDLEVDNVR
ncbi:MAG: CRISPR-associated endonuclease Cas2, partial [Spirulina sp. SIO3F2]|nr:CRISPR-associated endonuclease Cas2 [Spirulina sp. SIO3F2]